MRLTVTEAKEWSSVELAAAAAKTCIRLGGQNHDRAKQDWDNSQGLAHPTVQYFIFSGPDLKPVGYTRTLLVAPSFNPSTRVIDYTTPFMYATILEVAQNLGGSLLVKRRDADDALFTRKWPSLVIAFKRLADYTYHQCQPEEGDWMLVLT